MPRPRYRPVLELLEIRTVLSTITWTGSGDGTTWNLGTNWSTGSVPNSSSDAVISVGSAVNINLPSGGITVDSLTQTGGTLTIPSGTVATTTGLTLMSGIFDDNGGSITGTATIENSTLNLSSSAGSAQIVVGGPCTLNGTITANQTVRVEGGVDGTANLTLASGSANLGTILLQSTLNSSYANNLAVASGFTFTNTGTILVNPSSYTSNLTGSFINQGSFTVSGSATLDVGTTGLSFVQQAGSLTGTGQFVCNLGTLLVDGGTVSGAVIADGCSLQMASSITAATTVYAAGSTTLISNDSTKATVWVEGGLLGTANLTLAPGSANVGTILLQSTLNSSYANNLAVASGSTFTNTGTILVNPSSYTSNLTGSFINQGSLTVSGSATLDVGTSGLSFIQQSGNLNVSSSGVGQFVCNAGTFLVEGGTVGTSVIADGCSLQMASSITAATTVYAAGSTTLISNDSAKATVWAEGGLLGTSNLTLAPGSANVGTILLQSTLNSSYANNLAVASGSTFTNTGTILVNPSSYTSNLTGSFINQGSLTVSGSATLDVGTSGLSFIQQSGNLNVSSSGVGQFVCNAGTFLVEGGTVGTSVIADGCSLQMASSITAATTVYAAGSTTLISNDSTKATVWAEGGLLGTANLTLAPGSANVGTILLQSTLNSSYANNLAVASGSTFTNTGTILVNPSSYTSNLTGSFINQGSLTVSGSATLDVGTSGLSFIQQSGNLNVSSSGVGQFVCNAGTFLVEGGTVGTSVIADGCSLQMASSITAATTVYAAGSTTLISNDSTKATVWVEGGLFGTANLTVAQGAANVGTILLQPTSGSAYASNLAVISGSSFTNTGTITYNTGSNGSVFSGLFTNQGLLNINGTTFSLSGSGTTVTNSSTGQIYASGTIGDTSGSFTNSGSLSIGSAAAAGTLAITGAYTQTTSGSLNVKLGGTTAGTLFDQLNIAGQAVLAGALNVSLISPFLPVLNNSFKVLTFGSTAGTFATYSGTNLSNGLSLLPNQAATNLTLTTITSPVADLGVTVVAQPEQLTLGGDIVYLVTVTNRGPNPASVVNLADTLPSGIIVDSVIPSAGSYQTSGNVVTASFGTLASTSSDTLTIVVSPLTAGTYTDSATVSTITYDPNATNNTASDTATVVPPAADLYVSATAQPSQVLLGGNVTYVVTVIDNGPSTAAAATLADTLPSGVNIVSITPSVGTYQLTGNVVNASFGSITSGSSVTLTVVVTPSALGTYTDSATATSTTADPIASNNSASVTATATQPSADLSVTATAQPSQVVLGGNLTYLVTVTNNGPNPASMVSLADNLPAGATVVSITPSTGSYQLAGGVATASFGSLASGSSDTLSIVVTPLTSGTYTDSASATSATADPNSSNNSASASASAVPPTADLGVTVVSQPAQLTLGANFTELVTVINNGPYAASGVVLSNTLPTGATVVSSSSSFGTLTTVGTLETLTIGSMAVGSTVTLTVVLSPSAAGLLVDSASVSDTSPGDPNASNNRASATTTVLAPSADLSVTATAQPSQVVLGGNLTYLVTVTNNGPNPASMVSLADNLPAGATVVSITPSTGSYQLAGGVATASFGSLASGSSDTLSIVVTPLTSGTYTDSASATSATADPNSSNNSASASASAVPPTADLGVTVVSQPAQLTLGANFTELVTVINNGPYAASGVVLSNTLPTGATVVSSSSSFGTLTTVGTLETLTIGSMAVGSTVTLTVVLSPSAAGLLVDSASVSDTSPGDPNASNNRASATTTVLAPSADLSVTATAQPSQVVLGGNLTYLVTVTNNGPNPASMVSLADNLPAGATVVSITPSTGSYQLAGGVATASFGSLASGSSDTLSIVVTPLTSGTYTDSASATSATADPNSSNNSASATSTVLPPASADLSVAITGPPSVTSVSTLTFVVTVTNHGPNAANASTLVDTFALPSGASILSKLVSQGSSSVVSNTVTASFGTIAAGATSTLTIVVTTTVGGSFGDSATVQSTTADPVSSNNQASTTFPVSVLDTIAVTTSTASTSLKLPVTLNATVSSPAGFVKPSGTVTFLEGTTVLGSATLNASAVASITLTTLPLGTQAITASYSGDSSYAHITGLSTSIYVGDVPKSDFDGDGKADLAVYGKDPNTGKYDYRIVDSSTGKTVVFDNNGYGYGGAQSIPIVGDFFGDGRSSYALWTPNASGGMTFTAVSPITFKSMTINFGGTTDLPVVADVDGDGKADFGVYGYQAGLGYRFDFLLSSANFGAIAQDIFDNNGYGYGGAQSIPVVADFDGSGKAGFGLFNPSASGSTFTYISPSSGMSFSRTIGTASDIPMVVDDDGDGKADLALYGPDPTKSGQYRYLVLTSSSGYSTSQEVTFNNFGYGYGNQNSTPVMADYDGTGKADFAVFTPDGMGGMEYVYQTSQTGPGIISDFATATDLPLTAPTYLIARKVRGA